MTRIRPRRHTSKADDFRADAAALAFPKPRYVPREPADTSALALPKEHPDRDRAYLDFVRSELCAAWGEDGTRCGGVTEAAHLIAGLGEKRSDYYCVPLCSNHHRLLPDAQHNVGLTQFQMLIGVNLWQVATELLVRWVRRVR